MSQTYRNDHSFELIVGSRTVRPGAEIELDGYTGDMLTPVEVDPVLVPSTEYEEAAADAKPKRGKKPVPEPEAEQ